MCAKSWKCGLASALSFFTNACSALTSKTGLTSGASCPACLSMRASCMDIPWSFTTKQAGESTKRVVTRTSSALSLSASLSLAKMGLKVSAASSAAFFSASSCSEPKSTAPLATDCRAVLSNSFKKFKAHSSTRSVINNTSIPFLRKTSSCGLFLAAANVSAVM